MRVSLAASCLCALAARAETFVVDSTLDAVDVAPGDGLCANVAGACTLRAAVQEANALAGADAIDLPAGVFMLAIAGRDENAAVSGDLDLRGELQVRGAGAAVTIIDGGMLDRVVDTVSPAAGETSALTLRALGLRGGRLDGVPLDHVGQGAGLRVSAGVNLTLEDVELRDNALLGFDGAGALDNAGCTLGRRLRLIGNGDFRDIGSGNATAGAIMLRGGANTCLTFEDFEIANNRGDQAGAIHADEHAPATFRRGLIAGNSARFAGAILLNHDNEIVMENVTISGNVGGSGASLNDGGSRLRLRHCTVTANTGIPGSSAPIVGGLGDVHGGFGLTFLTNTLVAGNGPGFIADDCERATAIDGGNLIGSARGCLFLSAQEDQVGVPVTLGALGDHGGFSRDHLPTGTALDRAREASCLAVDQRGLARPRDGDGDGQARCDIGAIEVDALPDSAFTDGFEATALRSP